MGEEQCGDSVPYTCQELRGADYKTERCHRGRYIRCRKPREVEHKNYCERPNLMFGEGQMFSCVLQVCVLDQLGHGAIHWSSRHGWQWSPPDNYRRPRQSFRHLR